MLNKVVLIGRLTRDPELRYTPSGKAVANFTLAVDRPFRSASGEKETDFIPIVTWGKNAENCATYIAKGRLVSVEGRIQISKWENEEGQSRSKAEVVAEHVVFLEWGEK